MRKTLDTTPFATLNSPHKRCGKGPIMKKRLGYRRSRLGPRPDEEKGFKLV